MLLNEDMIIHVSKYTNKETRMKIALLSDYLFNSMKYSILHSHAKLTYDNTVTELHMSFALKKQCYICNKYYKGGFFPEFKVYAHSECMFKKKLRTIKSYRLQNPRISQADVENNIKRRLCMNLPNKYFTDSKLRIYYWYIKGIGDPVENKDTLYYNFEHENNTDRGIKRYIRVPSVSKDKKQKFEDIWNTRYSRINQFREYCKNVHAMNENQIDTVIRILEQSCSHEFFRFRKRARSSPEDIYKKNMGLFEAVKTNVDFNMTSLSLIRKQWTWDMGLYRTMHDAYVHNIYNQ